MKILKKSILTMMALGACFNLMANPIGATISNPIVIGSAATFSSSVNNVTSNGYSNEIGQVSDDVYYQICLTSPKRVDISLGNSCFDTYLHLLDASGAVIAYNDDNGPLCSGRASSIRRQLQTGTYYIVTEGYSSQSGSLELSYNTYSASALPAGAGFENPIDVSIQSDSFSYIAPPVNTNPANNYQNDFGNSSDDVIYRLTIAKKCLVSINTCYSDFDTYVYLLDINKGIVASNDDNGPYCTGSKASLQVGLYPHQTPAEGKIQGLLLPGTYYFVVEGYGGDNGNLIKADIFVVSEDNINFWYHREAASETADMSGITVAPNPASTSVYISIPGNVATTFFIYDSFGKIVKQSNLKSEANAIDVNDLTSGMYLLSLVSGNTVVNKKLEIVK